jgi:hypothetical protein
MSLEHVAIDQRRNHPPASEAPAFYWQLDIYGATAAGPVNKRLFVPGQGSINPTVQLWVKDAGNWRRLSPLDPRDEGHARRCMALMERDIMDRYLSDLNKR